MALWSARQIWKTMPKEQRAAAALSLWEGNQVSKEDRYAALAPWLAARGFRLSYLEQLPRPRRAALLAEGGLPEETAMQVLSSYHLQHRRPLLSRFLDLVGIPHEDGLFKDPDGVDPTTLTAEKLADALTSLRAEFPADDVDLYVRTLTAQDPTTWEGLKDLAGTPS